jgi:organic hydroperoxide reductase OsmC/OhrA
MPVVSTGRSPHRPDQPREVPDFRQSAAETLWQGLASLAQSARSLRRAQSTETRDEELEMQELPHHYTVTAAGTAGGDIELTASRVEALRSASPAEFDGPGDRWSPETLLAAAVADCFILTFRAIARASRLEWTSVRCDVTGTLDRVDRTLQFTAFNLHAQLEIPSTTDSAQATRALEKAERTCLISNSLKGAVHLVADVHVAELSPA